MARRIAYVAFCLLAIALGAGAHGDTIVTLHDVQPVDGLWQYDYEIDNTGGSAAITTLYLTNVDDATVFASPAGWGTALLVDSDIGGWVMWTADSGAELPPDSILSGFIIQSPYSSGTGTATAYVYDTDYNGYSFNLDGPASSSPEPAPLLLLGSGTVPLLLRRLRRRR